MSAKLTIEEMHALAQHRGGKCLSNKYVSAHSKLLWECAEGHQWKASPTHIKYGRWCPVCAVTTKAQKQRLDIQEMHVLAQYRGGKCLSNKYVSVRSKLLWECAEGHSWETTPNNVKRGSWCPICGIEKRTAKKRLAFNEMHRVATKKGGKCLSTTYKNTQSKLLWECEKGHQWEASLSNVKKGSWCPYCYKARRRKYPQS